MWTAQGALGALSSSLFAMEVSRKGRLYSATDSGCHRRGIPISRRAMLPGGESSLKHGVLLPPMHWRTALLWQTSVERQTGQHRTPSQDFTVYALS